MTFLYPAFLIGAAAIALPIVLHLLRRDVAPEVPFTAVHLLRRSPVERSRRRRLRDLLLLAARVIALLLLAAAFARPYRAAAVPQRLDIVAVDRSYSMTAPGRFARALDLARQAVDRAGGRVAVVAFDERAEIVAPPASPARARAALDGLQPGFEATRFVPVIASAIETADSGPARLVIVTDLQRGGWEDEQSVLTPASLQVDVADAGGSEVNAAVVRARVDGPAVVASIRNGGSSPFTGTVRVRVEDREVASAPVSVAGGATAEVSIRYQAPLSGSLVVTVDDPSGFAADNSRYVILDRSSERRVLIVSSGSAGSGFYLARALGAITDEDDGLAPDVVTVSAVARMSAQELGRHPAVILLSTRGIDRRARETLAGYVRGGGGLLVAAGPDLEPNVLATILDWPHFRPSLSEPEQPISLAATDLRHPIFRPFGALSANLGQVRFTRVWKLSPDGWDVAAKFTDATAALLERAEGAGRVVLFASDLDRQWNDFPLNPAFVPFAIESVRYAIGRTAAAGREYLVSSAPPGALPRPGVYHAPPDNRTVVINVDPRESSTARMTREEFLGMLSKVDVPAAAAVAGRALQIESRQNYWRYGLVLMLLALVAESFVGRADRMYAPARK